MDVTAWGRGGRTKLAAGAILLYAVVQIVALVDRSAGEPRNGDIRRYMLGEIYDEHHVEQRFVVRAPGLSSVTIHPRPASPSPTGSVTLTLRDVTGGDAGPIVHRESAPLPELARADAFTLRFPPQPLPNRTYALQIVVTGGSDGQGIGMLASRGDGDRRASLFVNGRRRYGSLVFDTTVDGASSNFGAIAEQMGRSGMPAPRAVLTLVLLLMNGALFALIQGRWQADTSVATHP